MASYNRVVLLGNVTRDIELRYIPSGMAVTDIGLAVNDKRKNANGEWVDETTFVDVTLWGRTAEIAGEYLSKGSPVFIEGRLQATKLGSRTGKSDRKLKVVGEKMQLLSSSGGSGGGARWRWRQYSRPAQQQYNQQSQHNQQASFDQSQDMPHVGRAARRRYPLLVKYHNSLPGCNADL